MLPRIITFLSGLIAVVLRVPPLFVMDFILQSPYGITLNVTSFFHSLVKYVLHVLRSQNITISQAFVMHSVYVIFHLLGLCIAMFSFLLPTKQLVSVYLSMASGMVLFWSYVMNEEYIKYCINLAVFDKSLQNELFSLNHTALKMFFGNYLSQSSWAIVFCFSSAYLHGFPPKKLFAGISFIFPTLFSILPLPESILSSMPNLALFVQILFLAYYVVKHRNIVCSAIFAPIKRFFELIGDFGLLDFLIHHWIHYNVFQVLKVFWLIRTFNYFVYISYDDGHSYDEVMGNLKEYIFDILEVVIPQSCDTILGVLGLTSILTSSVIYVVKHFQRLLGVPTPVREDLERVISVLFIMLAIQTGLTGLSSSERLLKVYRHTLLVLVAVSDCLVDDVLNALTIMSTSRNISITRHLRAIAGGAILIIYSCGFFIFFISMHSLSGWLLTACSFNIEVIIKTCLAFSIYVINLIDLRSTSMWEEYDDYIFFLKSGGHLASFLFNCFLLINACYIVLFESLGITRLILMIIHLHVNIWNRMVAGWNIYCKRQFANRFIGTLHTATEEELNAFDDVCSICHQTLQSAVITGCNHFFHCACLKRWLHEQNTCPFCHKHFVIRDHEHQE